MNLRNLWLQSRYRYIWLEYRHIPIVIVVTAGFAYASFRISPLACVLSLASVACTVAALKFFKMDCPPY